MRGKLENPFPYFEEATDAAAKIYSLQRDYLMVTAELRAKREGKRLAYMIASVILLNVTMVLSLFWVTTGLHEAGWSAWAIALLSFSVFGGLTALCVYLGLQTGKAQSTNPGVQT